MTAQLSLKDQPAHTPRPHTPPDKPQTHDSAQRLHREHKSLSNCHSQEAVGATVSFPCRQHSNSGSKVCAPKATGNFVRLPPVTHGSSSSSSTATRRCRCPTQPCQGRGQTALRSTVRRSAHGSTRPRPRRDTVIFPRSGNGHGWCAPPDAPPRFPAPFPTLQLLPWCCAEPTST